MCETILQLASTFDNVEPTDQALGENFAKIQAKFKQVYTEPAWCTYNVNPILFAQIRRQRSFVLQLICIFFS